MTIHTLKYILNDEGIAIMAGCASRATIEEHQEAIKSAFGEIDLTIEVDDNWGICKLLAVNDKSIEND